MQIYVFLVKKLCKGFNDIFSKVLAINKSLSLDKVSKNFYYTIGHITTQDNIVFCFSSTFSFDLIIGFKNLILSTLSLPFSTIISLIIIKQRYYILEIPINNSILREPLIEHNLLIKFHLNNPNILFTKVNILPCFSNSKFADS